MSTNKSDPPHSHHALIKSTSIISAGTLTSRFLGFLRDIIIAKFLGTGMKADAFFVAFRIPNLFRELVGEGAANSAIVPVCSEYAHKKDQWALWNFISVVFVLGAMILSVLTIIGIAAAPWIVKWIAPGFSQEPEKLQLTVQLTKFMFPYLILIGLTAYAMAVLYTFKSFFAPAFGPCLLNMALILSVYVVSHTALEPVFGLAIGVLVGGILQLFLQLSTLKKMGFQFIFPKDLRHPGALKIGRLLLPRIFGAGIYELNVFVDTFCASLSVFVGLGGISAIYYANRIIQFPMGIFSVALASAALPAFSGMAAANDHARFKKTLIFAIKNIFFILCPMSMMLVLLATPIIRVLFERGEFNAHSTQITSLALVFYAIGLFSFGGVKILVTAFYALQDTKTPVKVAALCLAIKAVLNFVLMIPLKIGGIALASSIAGIVNFGTLFYLLNKRWGDLQEGIGLYVLKIIAATILTGLFIYFGWAHIPFTTELPKLILSGFFAFVLYGSLCYSLRVEQMHRILAWMREWYDSQRKD